MNLSNQHKLEYLFISNYWPPDNRGGFEVGCMRLAQELASQGHSVSVVTSSKVKGSTNLLLNSCLLRYEQSHPLVRRLLVSVVNSLIVAECVLRFNPRYLVFFGLQNIGYLMLFQKYYNRVVPFVYCSDETFVHWDDICRRFLKNQSVLDRVFSFFFRLIGLNSVNVNRVTALHTSQYIRRITPSIFKAFCGNFVLHWGVNIDTLPVDTPTVAKVTIALGGRICPEKGIDLGLKAILVTAKTHPGVIGRVILLGVIPDSLYGREVDSLVDLLQNFDIEVVIKSVKPNEVQHELSKSDCFILASVWDEPFSIMLLEAMASGNFCVVTSTGGSSEICDHLRTGYLCKTPTVSEISQGVAWYLDNHIEGERIRREVISLIRSDFSMMKMANAFDHIIKSTDTNNPN
jgi:glycosyltransferase involved in cell wall biosynthesis